MQHLLIRLVKKAEVSNEDQSLMEQFLDIVWLIDIVLCVGEYKTEQVVQLLYLVQHHVLHDAYIHPHQIVQNLYAEDGQREDGLGEDHAWGLGGGRRGFECLIASQD